MHKNTSTITWQINADLNLKCGTKLIVHSVDISDIPDINLNNREFIKAIHPPEESFSYRLVNLKSLEDLIGLFSPEAGKVETVFDNFKNGTPFNSPALSCDTAGGTPQIYDGITRLYCLSSIGLSHCPVAIPHKCLQKLIDAKIIEP